MPTDTKDKVCRLIKAATGEEYGDGYTVTDLAIGYAEPGYGSNDSVIVFGNWNPKRFARGDDAPLTKAESLPERLAEAIERAGGHTEWLDEWATCGNCYRAMRTQADSYGWTMFGAYSEHIGEYTCAYCMREDIERCLEDWIDDPKRAVTWLSAHDLREQGWEQWEPGNPVYFESGWHPGQDDDPSAILETIKSRLPDASVLFHISHVQQFDIRFTAWIKLTETDEDE